MGQSKDIHLVVVIHGLWGTSEHVSNIGKALETAYADRGDAPSHGLKILHTASNESDFTYDGIDNCAYRCLKEIDDCIEELAPRRVARFSIIGYSLGGLIARYVLGALEARTPSFFETVEPVNFTTFASPAVGVPKFPTVFSSIINFCGARLLSRTGEQLYAEDSFHAGKPLLEIMSQPGTSFHTALTSFQRKQIFANAINDRTVPYPTGFFPSDYRDHFARADRIARAQHTYLDNEAADLELGGLSLTFKDDCKYLIEDVQTLKLSPAAVEAAQRKPSLFPALPFFFRPATFSGLPYKLGYVVPFLMPILLPSFIIYLLTRFMIQSRRSRQRIQLMTTGEMSALEAQLRRVGLVLEDTFEELAEDVFPAGPDGHNTEMTDPLLSNSQKRMTQNLNAIEGLEKHLAYLPNERNSHGAIIARDTRWDGHKKGLEILKWWSDRFVF